MVQTDENQTAVERLQRLVTSGFLEVVPVHPELQTALTAAASFGAVGQGRLIEVSWLTAWRWVQQAVRRATEDGQPPRAGVLEPTR